MTTFQIRWLMEVRECIKIMTELTPPLSTLDTNTNMSWYLYTQELIQKTIAAATTTSGASGAKTNPTAPINSCMLLMHCSTDFTGKTYDVWIIDRILELGRLSPFADITRSTAKYTAPIELDYDPEKRGEWTYWVLNESHTKLMICARSNTTRKPRSLGLLEGQIFILPSHALIETYGKKVSQYDAWLMYVRFITLGSSATKNQKQLQAGISRLTDECRNNTNDVSCLRFRWSSPFCQWEW